MRIIEKTTEFVLPEHSAVAIGKFDGLHLGHRKLLEQILEQKEKGLLSAVFTFEPAPEAFFSGKKIRELMSREEKRTAFAKMGIDVLIEFPLTSQTASIEAKEFIREYLAKKLRAKVIAAGSDLSFGHHGKGNAAMLEQMAAEYQYEVKLVQKVRFRGEEISSSLIRETVSLGDMEKAAALLGMPYQVTGQVGHGRQLGRKIGMPTVNLLPPEEKLLPPKGVYYSCVRLEGKRYPAVSNIGCKPTVSDEKVLGVESYLYDFATDIYGKEIEVELLSYKRPEQKFDSVDSLKSQMQRDIAEGARFHALPDLESK